MTSQALYDALVIGAGPSGSTAALTLARAGWRVLAVDKDAPGRGRVCGGFLGPEAAPLMKRLGLGTSFEAAAGGGIDELVLSGPGTPLFRVAFAAGSARAIDRRVFDYWLAQKISEAGVRLLPQTRVTNAVAGGGYWRVTLDGGGKDLEVRALHLIDATGRRTPPDGSPYFACKTAYSDIRDLDRRVALHFVERGHVGFNAVGEGRATLCLYVHAGCVRRFGRDFDAMMEFLGRSNPHVARHLDGARREEGWQVCAAEPDGRRVFYEDGIFRAGDAVTMVNPIIGRGITTAMESGWLLAEALVEGRRENLSEKTVAAAYRRRWRENFESKVRWAAALGRLERKSLATGAIFAGLKAFPGFVPTLVRMTRPEALREPALSA